MVRETPRRRRPALVAARGLLTAVLLAGSSAVAAQEPASPAPIPVTVLAVPFPIPGAPDAQVPLLIEVGGAQLLAGNPEGDVVGEIRATATDASGGMLEEIVQPFVLDPSDERLQRGLKLFAVMRLPAGQHQLRVVVSNAATRATGSWQDAVAVPDFSAGQASLSPPLFPQDPDQFRVFRQSESSHEGLPYPFEGVGGEMFLPAASAVAGGDGASFNVFLYGASGLPQRFAARLLDARGQASDVGVEVLGMASGSLPGQRRLALRLVGPLPPPGAYRLEVNVGTPGGGGGTTTAPLTVLAEAPPAPAALGLGERQPAAEEPAVLARQWSPEALAERYRELLLRTTSEGFEPVVAALTETELSATGDRRAGQLKALRQVEQRVVDGLAGAGTDSILPVIYLHYLADAEYLRRGQSWMAAQNRQWVDQLVDRWLARQRDATTRRLAAQLLAALGSLQHSLDLDPANELALLRQASGAERNGQLLVAAELLDRLVKAHPESAHGRLRQGVVLRRLGRSADAVRALSPLLERDEPRWIVAMAYQELAEIERRAGRSQRAEQLLRQGIERVGAQGLYVQLAFYLDERQQPDQAVAVVNSMPVTGDVESSGRHLYNGPPLAEIAAARRQVEERVGEGVSQLRVALGGVSAGLEGSR